MSWAGPIRRWRILTLRWIDQMPAARRTVTRLAAKWARLRGADSGVIADATEAGLPLDRTLQAMQWATALAGGARFPNHFEPGDHFVSRDHRRRAASVIRASDDQHPSQRLDRQRIGVDDDISLDELTELIEADLAPRLSGAASRPTRGAGLDPILQADIAGEIHDRLARIDVRPFLMSGSLLGVIRHGDFMDHDYDVDFGLLPGVDHSEVIKALTADGGLAVDVIGPRTVVSNATGVLADVFEHEFRDDRFWHATLIHEWWNTPFELTEVEVGGRTFWIPDAPERYLDENYGDWSSPLVFFDISFDTPNRRYRSNHHALRYLYSRCIRALATNDRWLLEAAARELRDAFGIDVTEHLAPTGLLRPQT